MKLHELNEHNTKIWLSDQAHSYFKTEWFEYSQSSDVAILDEWQSGRQSIARFNVDEHYMVLRHYCRGGFPAHFTKDRFFFRGHSVSRSFKELELLQIMHQAQLPMPEPIAARCIVNGIVYRADIIMHEIRNSKTLAQIIVDRQLEQAMWKEIGRTIGRFHREGIQHVDLNANNILIDVSGDVFLIDFDRCVQRTYSQRWGYAGLNRLKISLQKLRKKNPKLFYQGCDFTKLVEGYEA